MKLIVMMCLLMGFIVPGLYGEVFAGPDGHVAVGEVCPKDLLELEEKMEVILGSVFNETFKKTIRGSLQASIPEAIQRSDGINAQIIYLRAQIREQNRSQSYAENVARKATNNMDKDLVACHPGEKGSYCDAVEQYYIGQASNLANHGFLNALECYKRQGFR